MSNRAEQLNRVRCCIEGLSIGDALGERWFFTRRDLPAFEPIADRTLPPRVWDYTDDTQMALSIAEVLSHHDGIDQDALAESFANRFDRQRGYGPAMYNMLPRLQMGESWQYVSKNLFNGQGSYGNGSAMRVATVGAYFADNLSLAVEHARLSAEVTHAHPEAVAGAIAVAAAAALAWQAKQSDTECTKSYFLNRVLAHVPHSEVYEGIQDAIALANTATIKDAVSTLSNGSGLSAQDTVPFALWCAATHLNNFEEAIWLTMSGSGDIDTNCAIVGGIVVMYSGVEGIPPLWLERREKLPDWPFTMAYEH